MASTVTLDGARIAIGNKNMRTGTFNLGAYATSGVAITNTQLGMNVIDRFFTQTYGGVVYEPVVAAAKTSVTIKCYWQTDPAAAGGANVALTEVTDTTSLATHVVQFIAIGR